ncbi:hypothetical protein [Acidithiobacillus ferrivorans]|uniref:hypothetical protein n=1 Tax=Acidithiobacillus ferrivorans TaxID=160808 RepID=UPI0016806B72|nr:hypothetical protein [Acidithiobacillus ferrivorans]
MPSVPVADPAIGVVFVSVAFAAPILAIWVSRLVFEDALERHADDGAAVRMVDF